MTKIVSNHWYYKGVKLHTTWHETDKLPKIAYTQVYPIAFNKSGKVMVARKLRTKVWNLPGGTPEYGETFEETVIREADEEASIDISHIKLLGYSDTQVPKNRAGIRPGRHVQLRCFAMIDKINPRKPDPDGGVIRVRKLIDVKDFSEYIRWHGVGRAIIKAALKEYNNYTNTKKFSNLKIKKKAQTK